MARSWDEGFVAGVLSAMQVVRTAEGADSTLGNEIARACGHAESERKMTMRKVMRYGTLNSDEGLCGVNIARGGWTQNAKRVTCHRCLVTLANQRIDKRVLVGTPANRRTGVPSPSDSRTNNNG